MWLTEGYRPEMQWSVVDVEVQWRRWGRSSRRRALQAPPGVRIPWFNSWSSCGGAMGVSEVREWPAARNCGSGATHRWRCSGTIPVM